ncbi:MAG TPA: PIN domain-containing protein [Tepidiformaceae bacterium]|nr:PIN domain-containing protein [Tepidiformaceae bacterium]
MDTSGFYSALNPREGTHGRAREVLREAGGNRLVLWTSNFVVAETHALLLGRRRRDIALSFLRSLDAGQIRIERVSERDEAEARAIIERYQDKDFSYTDATSFAIMGRRSVTRALTFDRDFMQFGIEQA